MYLVLSLEDHYKKKIDERTSKEKKWYSTTKIQLFSYYISKIVCLYCINKLVNCNKDHISFSIER